MARTIWKGSISFGLVNIPVALQSAQRREELSFTLLDGRDMSPVGYKRVNKATGEEVEWDRIVKGYEYGKDQYVVLGEEEFRRANVKATQTIEILDFVEAERVPFVYYDRPYYLEPTQRGGEKGYALLRETLNRTGRAGIAQVVLRTRQHLALVAPLEDVLVLNLLRYHYEVRGRDELRVPGRDLAALRISEREIEMAERLVEDMTTGWDPARYRDEYRDDLMRVIQEKVESGKTLELETPQPGEAARGAEVVDFMTLLKRSVEQMEKSRAGKGGAEAAAPEPRPRKRAASPRRRPPKRA